MALNAGISRKSAIKALETLINGISETLKKGERINLKGLGSLTPYERTARVGRNPKTNQPLHIPAKKTIKFKASPQLINNLN
tara:strand:+ start:566 stop:811 length:246 start_codon:yes stop_codon:yes gene_type:complete